MSAPTILKVARTEAGVCVRIEGRGTSRQSPAVREFLAQAKAAGDEQVTLDLTACDYLDSTFLGLLLALRKQLGPDHLSIVADPPTQEKLFGPTALLGLLTMIPRMPSVLSEWIVLSDIIIDKTELARHMMECHRHLAEISSPHQAAFTAIADQLERELRSKGALPARGAG